MNRAVFLLCIFLSGAAVQAAQSLLLKNGLVYTITGPILNRTDILITGGKIEKIGRNLEAPKGTKAIDLKGQTVMPGLVLAKESSFSGWGSPPESVDVYSISLRFALSTGITSVLSDGYVIKMTYGDPEGVLVAQHSVLRMSKTSWGSRYQFRQQLLAARDYLRKLSIYNAAVKTGGKAEKPAASRMLQQYAQLLEGKIPIRAGFSSKRDLLHAVSLAHEFNLRFIFEDAIEAWTVADAISEVNGSVIFSVRRETEPPADPDDAPGSNVKAAAILKKKGVPFALVPPSNSLTITGGPAGRGLTSLMMEAAFAVRGGLDEATALRSITIVPAKLLGLDQRIGSIEKGKDADLIILDGDPLHWKTFVTKTIINGKVYYDRAKDGVLAE